MKKFILNADDLAKSENHNRAVYCAYENGFLRSASIMANMPFFTDAIEYFANKKDFSLGIHLNLTEGRALNPNLAMLCSRSGKFDNNFLTLLLKSYNKNFLAQVEYEFRSQIELVLKYTKPSHIDSHVHIHAIPNIFKIVAKLACEYNIPQIRTQREIPYFIFGKKYNPLNFIKVLLLNIFTFQNKKTLQKYKLQTNDYLIGVSYTSSMDSRAVFRGLKKIKTQKPVCIVETLIHPCLYESNFSDNHKVEFDITRDFTLKSQIEAMGWEF